MLFGFRSRAPGAFLYEHFKAWGEHWGRWLEEDDPDDPFADAVIGFSLQNHWCRDVKRAYDDVIDGGGTEKMADIAAEAEAERHFRLIVGFAEGVRDTYPAAARVPAGLPDWPWRGDLEVRCLRWLAETGAFGGATGQPLEIPILTGVGLHFYGHERNFEIGHDGGTVTVSPDEWSFTGDVDALLEAVFTTPGMAEGMALYVQELNVDQPSFGWSLGAGGTAVGPTTVEFEAARRAAVLMLDEAFADGRLRYAGVYSPFIDALREQYLVSVDYAFNAPEEDPVSPSGVAVQGYSVPTP